MNRACPSCGAANDSVLLTIFPEALERAAALIVSTPPGALLTQGAIEALGAVAERLSLGRPSPFPIVVVEGATVELADEARMRAAGWVRA